MRELGVMGTGMSVEDARRYIEDRVVVVPWSGCWLWEGCVRNGYGVFRRSRRAPVRPGRLQYVHRFSYALFHGEIATAPGYHGAVVMHRCDVPACCNPDHLRIGTQSENCLDMHAKRRGQRNQGERHPSSALTEVDVRTIRAMKGESNVSIAQRFGVCPSTVSLVRSGRTWRHVQ